MINKPVKFSLIVQWWKGQEVIRAGPSMTVRRFLLDLSAGKSPVTSFNLDGDPFKDDSVSAVFQPCEDGKALERGKPMEDKEYLKPKEGSFWNDTKDTPSWSKQLDSGEVIFYIDNDQFKKFLVKGNKLKGVFTLKRDDTSNMWTWEKDVGPGGKRD